MTIPKLSNPILRMGESLQGPPFFLHDLFDSLQKHAIAPASKATIGTRSRSSRNSSRKSSSRRSTPDLAATEDGPQQPGPPFFEPLTTARKALKLLYEKGAPQSGLTDSEPRIIDTATRPGQVA